jgi:hypothetical protein
VARQSQLTAAGPLEWVTVTQAAARLNMPISSFQTFARSDGLEVMRRGRRPGVKSASVQAHIGRSRISGPVNETLRRQSTRSGRSAASHWWIESRRDSTGQIET